MKPSEKTLFDYFETFNKERGNDIFILDEKRKYTVCETFNIVKGLAFQLQGAGIKQGSYIVVKAQRTIECVFVFYAIQFIGGIAVMCGPHDRIEYDTVIDGTKLKIGDCQIHLELQPCGQPEIICDSKITTAVIFTSGSTGGSKAVKLSQYNFINNSLDTAEIGGYRENDVNVVIVPLHHVFGLALIMTAVVTKHSVFVPENVDTNYILDCMENFGITRLNGVPSMYLALAENSGDRKLKLNCGLIGGGPCTKEQFLRIEKALGITLIPVYGMSECIGISCGSYYDSIDDRCDSVGRVYSMNTVKIVDGEILVKSPAMSSGYVGANILDGEGWLHTGDLGYLDEKGFLHISGRKKDIIIRNGNNLPVVEIERKILTLPEVKDVCVVGIADELCGEVPCALIVGESVDLTKVLTKIELPKKVIYAEAIPLTCSGKPDKQKVIKLFT